jgi:hypothetical protein
MATSAYPEKPEPTQAMLMQGSILKGKYKAIPSALIPVMQTELKAGCEKLYEKQYALIRPGAGRKKTASHPSA